jgi:phytoene dehydrogenase-like protein
MVPVELDVAIIGAGLAGLACARDLTKAGLGVQLFESADAAGGRVRTDVVDGFRLDRGFQVLLTEYPEAKRVLDYDALALRRFVPGALVRTHALK